MHLPMATVVTTTLVAALGGVPGALACAGSSFIHHTHTPCNPIYCPDEQAPSATNGTQATRGPPHPQGTHPSIPNLADGWQVCSKAGRGPHSPIPTALHPPRAVPSAAQAKGAATSTSRSPRQSHKQIGAAALATTPQWPDQRSSAPTAAPPTPHHRPHAPHRPSRACTLPITTTTTTTWHVKHMAK